MVNGPHNDIHTDNDDDHDHDHDHDRDHFVDTLYEHDRDGWSRSIVGRGL
jgi:ABC-type Zn2+ transport system substrate-binding protein/surface adhesin